MNELLLAAVRQAINDSEAAAGSPDDLLTLQARAAAEAVERLGYVEAHGVEYAVKRGDVVLESGFNTEEQARLWVERRLGAVEVQIVRRWVGVWEPAE